MTQFVLITCEHGGNQIPSAYRHFFRGRRGLLNSHRGYDAGALVMAQELAAAVGAPLVSATVSRLLVDLNRSVGHARFHIEAVRAAGSEVREAIVKRYYDPYRAKVERHVARAVAHRRRVIHISAHSFTPQLDGEVRTADVAFLYDPARPGEVALSKRWKTALQTLAPHLNVRRNYPYAGKGDGLTRSLRRRYSRRHYVGIELEINQKHVAGPPRRWRPMRLAIVESLRRALAGTELIDCN